MESKNPNFLARAKEIFNQAAFIQSLGIQLVDCKPGYCETSLEILDQHLQQDGVVHAGVLATMADHTAGAAAGSLISEKEIVLTVEFKINLLRPAKGEKLISRAKVLKPGKNLTTASSEVFSLKGSEEKLVAVALVYSSLGS